MSEHVALLPRVSERTGIHQHMWTAFPTPGMSSICTEIFLNDTQEPQQQQEAV